MCEIELMIQKTVLLTFLRGGSAIPGLRPGGAAAEPERAPGCMGEQQAQLVTSHRRTYLPANKRG